MNKESFEILVNILKMVRRNECVDFRNIIEIISEYKERITLDQQSEILKILIDYPKDRNANHEVYQNASNEIMMKDSEYF